MIRDWLKKRQRRALLAKIDELHDHIQRCERARHALFKSIEAANGQLRVARIELGILDKE